jgi:hypothetical protein
VPRPLSRIFLGATILTLTATVAESQRSDASAGIRAARSALPASARAEGGGNAGDFALEAAAGALGSLAGIGLTALVSNCGIDDLECTFKTVGAGGLLGALGATAATTVVARQLGSPRSAGGAALGAVVGTGVGLGVHYLLNRESDRNLGDAVVVPIFVVSQGLFAAIGSRLLGAR